MERVRDHSACEWGKSLQCDIYALFHDSFLRASFISLTRIMGKAFFMPSLIISTVITTKTTTTTNSAFAAGVEGWR